MVTPAPAADPGPLPSWPRADAPGTRVASRGARPGRASRVIHMGGYTDAESRTLRTAVYGAMVLVSVAEEGALDQESHAGIRAMAALPPEVRRAVDGGAPELPAGSVADVEHGVLAALRESVALVSARSAAEADDFAAAVLAMCEEVASADGAVGRAEGAVVAKVRAALEHDRGLSRDRS